MQPGSFRLWRRTTGDVRPRGAGHWGVHRSCCAPESIAGQPLGWQNTGGLRARRAWRRWHTVQLPLVGRFAEQHVSQGTGAAPELLTAASWMGAWVQQLEQHGGVCRNSVGHVLPFCTCKVGWGGGNCHAATNRRYWGGARCSLALLALCFVGSYPTAGLLGCASAVVRFQHLPPRSLSLWTPLVAVGHRQRSLGACGRQGKQDKSGRVRRTWTRELTYLWRGQAPLGDVFALCQRKVCAAAADRRWCAWKECRARAWVSRRYDTGSKLVVP